MALVSCGSFHILGKMFQVICILATMLELIKCSKGFEKPVFAYIERRVVWITFPKGENASLYLCCNSLHIVRSSCKGVSICPQNKTITDCETRKQKVSCEIPHIQDGTTMRGYLGRFDGKKVVQLSDVATFVTNKSAKIPRSVSGINVTKVNSQQRLDIQWKPLTFREYSFPTTQYNYIVECQPVENQRAKAALARLPFGKSEFRISSNNLTAVSKYRCCVNVVNVLNSQESEKTCQDVTTSEQAPSAAPNITCSDDTAAKCSSVTKGTKRNVTIEFQLPSREHRNGHIMSSIIYYNNNTTDNELSTDFQVFNGSNTTAELIDLETAESYVVFMKSCTRGGCSPRSNMVHISAEIHEDRITEYLVHFIVSGVAAGVFLVLVTIVCLIKRRRQLQREEGLPPLKPVDYVYDYPPSKENDDDNYHELEVQIDKDIVVANPVALGNEQR